MTDTLATNRRLGWVVGLTSTAYFMVILDSVVVITALPHMIAARTVQGLGGAEPRHQEHERRRSTPAFVADVGVEATCRLPQHRLPRRPPNRAGGDRRKYSR